MISLIKRKAQEPGPYGHSQRRRNRRGEDAIPLNEMAPKQRHTFNEGDPAHLTLKGTTMSTSLRILAVSALFAGSAAVFTGAATAAPIGQPRALVKAVPNITQSVQWRGGGWGWGAPVAGGIIGGAIIGGALAAPYGPGYYGPGYVRRPGRTVLLPVTRSDTACGGSGLMIRVVEHISATTGIVIPVLE